MKNGKNWIGMLVFVLVFGMAAIGCDKDPEPEPSWQASNIAPFGGTMATDWTTMTFTYEGSEVTLTKTSGNSGSLDGKWTGIVQGTSVIVTFSGGNWTTTDTAGNNLAKGTVIVNGTNLTITITHMWDSGGSSSGTDSGGTNSGGVSSNPPPGIPLVDSDMWHQLEDIEWIKEGAINNLPRVGFYNTGNSDKWDAVEFGYSYASGGGTSSSRLDYLFINGNTIYHGNYYIPQQNDYRLAGRFNISVSENTLTISNWIIENEFAGWYGYLVEIIEGTYKKRDY